MTSITILAVAFFGSLLGLLLTGKIIYLKIIGVSLLLMCIGEFLELMGETIAGIFEGVKDFIGDLFEKFTE